MSAGEGLHLCVDAHFPLVLRAGQVENSIHSHQQGSRVFSLPRDLLQALLLALGRCQLASLVAIVVGLHSGLPSQSVRLSFPAMPG